MDAIKLKRVYDEYDENDGYRVLVDRLWPRGVKKAELHYDFWAKDITPSPELRKWFHIDPDKRWQEFSEMYRKELSNSEAVKSFIQQIKGKKTITLLYASKDKIHNHALILKDFLEKVMP